MKYRVVLDARCRLYNDVEAEDEEEAIRKAIDGSCDVIDHELIDIDADPRHVEEIG